MRNNYKYITKLTLILILIVNAVQAQYPGGVSSGTVRGFKVDYYNGNFSNVNQFGEGTANNTPELTCYSDRITGTEFTPVDSDYYGLEYTGILEIPTTGNYTFKISGDDVTSLYIDGLIKLTVNNNNSNVVVNLTAGDHAIKVKYYELGGANSATLQFNASPAGSNITPPTDLDGRFVRVQNVKLAAWYKTSDISAIKDYGGTGIDKVKGWTNKAPDYTGTGNMTYTGSGYATRRDDNLINFNYGVTFDGDDRFRTNSTVKGLSLRAATKTIFMVNNYVQNIGQADAWMFFNGDQANGQRFGFWKSDATGNQLAVQGSGTFDNSDYTLNEPKLLTGFQGQLTGGTISSTTNPVTLRSNGSTGTTSNLTLNADYDDWGLQIANMDKAVFPEAIYYPFELSTTQQNQVNTYLAIKYGIRLPHDYLNTSGNTIFSLTTNSGYTNRIFGIGKELVAEGLEQKQSQSQMVSATGGGNDFLIISKGTIATSNNANTGILNDGDYLILGDNGTSAITQQANEIPTSFSSGFTCSAARINREWKVQVTGSPGSVTFQAGSDSYYFPVGAAGLSLLIDRDGNGDFTNGIVDVVAASSLNNGVATFNNVSLSTGNVITFAWSVIAPGGVSNGLTLWAKADQAGLATGAVTTMKDYSANSNTLVNNGSINKVDNLFNYNPTLEFRNGDNRYLESTNPLGMNGNTKYGEFYVLKSIHASGITYDEIITLGGATSSSGHRWENTTSDISTGYYGVFGPGTINNDNTTPVMGNLALYSHVTEGTGSNITLRANGVANVTTAAGTLNLGTGKFRIGTDIGGGDGNYNGFYSPELIVYNTNLSNTDINRINSYLAIKYSIPLNGGLSSLISSNNTTIWTSDTTYKNDIMSIGRDDCSGLLQKQSTAYTESTTNNLSIALGTFATDNSSNTNNFTANNQFLVVAHNGGALAPLYTGIPTAYASCNAARLGRTWKAANTGNLTGVQLVFGNSSFPIPSNYPNLKLVIDTDGDGNFTNASTFISATSNIGGVATFNNVTIPNGATFTLVFTVGFPGGVSKPSTGTVTINSVEHVNGLTYKMYTINNTAGRDLGTTPFIDGSNGDVLRSTGYYNNTSQFDNFAATKVDGGNEMENFGVELTGKFTPATSGTNYRFRLNAIDDQAYFEIRKLDGTLINNLTVTSIGNASSTANLTLNAGEYYNIIVRGADRTGGSNFDLQISSNSGSSYTTIADDRFFTPVPNLSAWYATDDSLLFNNFADGASFNGSWLDLSGNGNTLTDGANDPVYYKTTAKKIRNFNPVMDFTNDKINSDTYLNGFSYGKQPKTVIGVSDMYTSGAQENLTGFGRDNGTDDFFSLIKTSGNNLNFEEITSPVVVSNPFVGNRAAYILEGDLQNGNIFSTNNASVYINNKQRSLGSRTAWNVYMNDNEQVAVGNRPDGFLANGWNGAFSEILYYPWALSTTERQKVNSYLAVKWGITLDQSTPTNYIASDGSIIWSASLANGYVYDITSIGRDDCGGLNQKQSTSTDGDDIVSIAIGGIKENNIANTNSFANNTSFLTIANNNANVTLLTNHSDLPANMAECYTHFDRIWQVQTLNNPGPVTVAMGKKGLVTINASLYRPVLLVSNTNSFTNATAYNYSNNTLGIVYFDNVSFSNGQYFTMAYVPAGPGGVTTGMTTWFNSDYDVYTDTAQTTPAVNAGDVVKSINNLKTYAAFTKVEEVASNANPTYQPGSFNYNAGILFDGVNDVLATSENISTLDYRSINQMTSIFSGFDIGNNQQNVYWYHDANVGGRKTSLERNQAFWSDDNTHNLFRNPTLTSPEIYTFANTVGGTWRLYSNLTTVGSGSTGNGNTTNTNGRFRIGNYSFGSTGTNAANFYLGEFTIFSDDKGDSNSSDMRRIHSYEAMKYGFTLDRTAMGGAYLASNGTTQTFNYSTHWNRITVIGRDDCSALEQKQSKSSESGMMVKISNDPVNGIAATNQENKGYFTDNRSFEAFGDDNKSLIWTGKDKIYDATYGNLVRLLRTWRVKETGTVGTIYLEVNGNGSTESAKLPAGATTSSPVYLIVSTTSDFKNPVAIKEMLPNTLPNATKWSTTYDFADGNYYTFATTVMCLAPGGNSEGLTSWYKFNNKPLGALTNVTDDSPSGYTLPYGSGSTTVNVTAGTATQFNYNRYLPLTGTTYFEKAGMNETSVYSVNAGTTFAVGNASNKDIMGFGRITSPFRRTGLAGNNSYFNDAANAYPTSSNTPNILVANTAPGSSSATKSHASWNNGNKANTVTLTAADLPAASDYRLRLGGITPNDAGVYNKELAEGITYNRGLSIEETQIVNTYLALKYGQTLAHNYYSPNYDGTNASTTTIYDITTHGNRVFGVGNDIAGCFYQNQSTSALSGSMLKISIDGGINTENSQDPSSWPFNQTYIAIGDNNGDVNTNGWITSSTTPLINQPALYTYTNSCAKRISRQWKITTTGTNPSVLITVPGSTSTTSVTKLPAIPVSANANSLYMVVNDDPDFGINANQSEILMTLNPATGDYETNQTFAAGVTKYITFIYRPKVCRNCIITNTATSTTRKN